MNLKFTATKLADIGAGYFQNADRRIAACMKDFFNPNNSLPQLTDKIINFSGLSLQSLIWWHL
jgi:hypothetical protein